VTTHEDGPDQSGLGLSLAEHAPLPMAMVEGTGHLVCYVNPSFCHLIAQPADALIGHPFGDILREKPAWVALLDRVYRTGKAESHAAPDATEAPSGSRSCTMWPVLTEKQIVGVMIQVTETAPVHARALAMNEALMLGSVRQHQLTEAADSANILLQAEIGERKQAEAALHRAQAQLTDRAGQLAGLVNRRTSELSATNKRLKASVDSNRKGKEQFRLLYRESQVMQKKLSRLTRQIITVQEEERKAISRELHDDVVQTLVGINVELAALSQGATPGAATLRKKIARTQRLVADSVNEVHRFARELRPTVLDDFGLIPALHAYNKSLAERKKIKIDLTAFGGVEALGGAERTVLFRVAQEALTNVVRHAHATQVIMNISELPGAIRMEISDDGKSFPVRKTFLAKNPKRLGLVGMRERIEMVGGNLTIESTPGQGTTVRAELPFNPAKSAK